MESMGMVLIVALAYDLSQEVGGIATALPVLGALALGAQRLLPALQQIYSAWADIVGSYASLVDAIELLDQPLPAELTQPSPAPLLFQSTIRFDGVSFRYSDDGPWVLNGFDLVIAKGARVGFVGSTGSGKSTTLDLLMGLLMPTEGQLLVDGQSISGNLVRAWQQTIAHVPQSIYLADTTLAENIAFGVPPGAIDMDRVRQAARHANISEFIESSPRGYQAYVGEQGIRLSGGQRQRIGIARALYKQADVIIFDEATSALDSETELAVMQAIESLSKDLTLLIIAHRLTTLKNCTQIVELGKGGIKRTRTYQDLVQQPTPIYSGT
jgi:ATP-binding cassette subfamily B protein